MRKRVLISGGAGYVGRALARELYATHDVCVVDTLTFGPGRLSAQDRAQIQLETVDILDLPALTAVVERFRPDVIVHLAAIHFIPLCENQPGASTATNIIGLVNLLSVCPPSCRFVFASSGAVYAPSDDLHDEVQAQIGPRDVYGFNKLHGEDYVRYFAQSRGLASVVVRLFNVAGPGETNPHLLPEIIAQLKAGLTTIRLGNMWPKRDYIHVADAARGFAAVALRGEVPPGAVVTVNLGTARQYSVEEILTRLRVISGLDIVVEHDPSRARAVDRPYLGADIRRIEAAFGWRPQHDIDDALTDLWTAPDLSPQLTARYNLDAAPPSLKVAAP